MSGVTDWQNNFEVKRSKVNVNGDEIWRIAYRGGHWVDLFQFISLTRE